jgi:hypothetical protein
MKQGMAVGLLCLWTTCSWGAAPAVLLSAYATSRSVDSASPICLLDPQCQGHWAPGSKDQGVNDGLYYQFENPIQVDYILVRFKDPSPPSAYPWSVRFYIDGKTTSPNKTVYAQDTFDDHTMRIGIRGGEQVAPMGVRMKSFFLCINPGYAAVVQHIAVERIQFMTLMKDKTLQSVAIELPVSAEAHVTATSVLDPFPAYQPAHLFDSRTDLSWATNGQKTSGVNESFTVEFNEPQEANGLLIWNGYERSSTHYQANGRVRSAEIKTDDGISDLIQLRDVEGPQRIPLARNHKARRWTFTIKEIVPGSKYHDVLISELLLVQPSGRLLVPRVEMQTTPSPAAWAPLMDRSWTSVLRSIETGGECGGQQFSDTFRIRSDGTFIIYIGKEADRNDNRTSAVVLEGNWESKDDQIRIFGKKYSTDIVTSEYLNESHKSAPVIFQSFMSLKRYRLMTAEEKRNILATTVHWDETWNIAISSDSNMNVIHAKGLNSFISKTDQILNVLNPYFVQSPTFSALLLPTDDISQFGIGGCE